jgi:hypothetical protein
MIIGRAHLGSFAGVIELIMFNRPTSTRSGYLLRRVNFAVPDNFRPDTTEVRGLAVPARTKWGWAGRREQPVIDTGQSWLDPVMRLERIRWRLETVTAATTPDRDAGAA